MKCKQHTSPPLPLTLYPRQISNKTSIDIEDSFNFCGAINRSLSPFFLSFFLSIFSFKSVNEKPTNCSLFTSSHFAVGIQFKLCLKNKTNTTHTITRIHTIIIIIIMANFSTSDSETMFTFSSIANKLFLLRFVYIVFSAY